MPLRILLVLATLWNATPSLSAQEGSPGIVPQQTSVLEIAAPRDASVIVDGKDFGSQRRFMFHSLDSARTYTSKLRVRFASGRESERSVLLRGGWHVRLAAQASDRSMPELLLQAGHASSANHCAYSPDGRYIVTGSGDATAILWDAASGRQLRTFAGHTKGITGVAFTPDGRNVVTGSFDDSVIVWDATTGRRVQTIEFGGCWSLALSPDGTSVLAGERKRATLWDLKTGVLLRTFDGQHKGVVSAVAFSPDGRQCVTACWDTNAVLWDVATGEAVRWFRGHRFKIEAVAFSPDARHVVTGSGESDYRAKNAQGELILWERATAREVRRLELPSVIRDICVAPKEGLVAVRSLSFEDERDKTESVLLEMEQLRPLRTLRDERGSLACAFSPDGRFLCDGGLLWDVDTGKPHHSLASTQAAVNEVAWASDAGQILITGVRCSGILDLENSDFQEFAREQNRTLVKMQSARNGRVVAMARETGTDAESLLLFGPSGGVLKSIPLPGSNGLESISADGHFALTKSYGEKSVVLWDLQTGQRVRAFGDESNRIWHAAALSADGKTIIRMAIAVALFAPTTVHHFATLRNASSGEELKGLTLTTENRADEAKPLYSLRAVGFTPDGRQAVTAGLEMNGRPHSGIMLFWNVATGEMVRALRSHTEAHIRYISFTPDGRYMLSHAEDYSTIVWDTATGAKLRTFTAAHTGSARPSLSPDGRTLLAVSSGSLRLFDVATGDELARLVRMKVDGSWLTVTPEGLFDGSEVGRQRVAYRVGGGLNVVPVDRFFQDFYYPGLLAAIWRGERPLPEVELGGSQPPRVTILTPTPGSVDSSQVTLRVEVRDQGGGVSGIRLFQNGARVLALGENRQEGKTVHRTFDVALIEGRNHLKVTASNVDGSWESEPAEIVLTYERQLAKSELYLVAIGVSKYADASMNLQFAAQDARALADLFRSRGDGLYGRVHVATLLDEQATRPRIKEALRQAAARTRSQDTLVVFLAGHGTMVGQRYYFLPHELRRRAAQLEEDIREQGLPADELNDQLTAASALKRVLIVDTCASGGALALASRGRSGVALRGAIERLSRSSGLFTIAAAGATQEAQESAELGHGVLSYTLLAGLKGVQGGPLRDRSIEPSSAEGVIDVLEWFTFAAGQVPRLTERLYGAAQDVQTSTQGQSFPVLPLDD